MSSIGIPIKLLHEAEGHIVTIEVRSGDVYRGRLALAEDNMNVTMQDAIRKSRDGREQRLDAVFLRGSAIRMVVVPDMLENAPFFCIDARRQKNRGMGRGNKGIFRHGNGPKGPRSNQPPPPPPH